MQLLLVVLKSYHSLIHPAIQRSFMENDTPGTGKGKTFPAIQERLRQQERGKKRSTRPYKEPCVQNNKVLLEHSGSVGENYPQKIQLDD